MLDYIQIYPETIAMVKRYPASDRALLYEAMVSYGTEGTVPDWPEDDLKWLIWESLRQRIEAAARKSETNRANRRGRTATNENETQRNETNENEPQQNETNRNPETDTESEPDPEAETYGDMDTHTNPPQPDTAPARARPGWFDPANPAAGDDGAWKYSEPARRATAQRILAHVINTGLLKEQFSVTEDGVTLGEDLFEVLCAALKYGMTPRECLMEADDWQKTWQWERELRKFVVSQGGSVDLPERRVEQELAYG